MYIGADNNLNIKYLVGEDYLDEYSEADFVVIDNFTSHSTNYLSFGDGNNASIAGVNMSVSTISEPVIAYDGYTGNVTITPKKMRVSGIAAKWEGTYWSAKGSTMKQDFNIPFKVYLLVKTPNANI